MPRANEVPPRDNLMPPIAPHIQEVNQRIPQNPEVLIAPVGAQANPPMVREDMLYERFRCMKALEFEGLTDPIEA